MNCRRGDIARFVGSGRPMRNYGRFVICEVEIGEVCDAYGTHWCWRIDPPLFKSNGDLTDICPDAWLRPIRDTGAPDEMLERIGRPEGVPA